MSELASGRASARWMERRDRSMRKCYCGLTARGISCSGSCTGGGRGDDSFARCVRALAGGEAVCTYSAQVRPAFLFAAMSGRSRWMCLGARTSKSNPQKALGWSLWPHTVRLGQNCPHRALRLQPYLTRDTPMLDGNTLLLCLSNQGLMTAITLVIKFRLLPLQQTGACPPCAASASTHRSQQFSCSCTALRHCPQKWWVPHALVRHIGTSSQQQLDDSSVAIHARHAERGGRAIVVHLVHCRAHRKQPRHHRVVLRGLE